jgi:hypothetical protein
LVLSQDCQLTAMLTETFGSAEVVSTSDAALSRLYKEDQPRPEMLFVDASHTPDALRFIDFIKGSGWTRQLPVIAVAPAGEDFQAIERLPAVRVLRKPLTQNDVRSVLAA